MSAQQLEEPVYCPQLELGEVFFSACLSTCLSVHPSVCLSASVCLPDFLSVCPLCLLFSRSVSLYLLSAYSPHWCCVADDTAFAGRDSSVVTLVSVCLHWRPHHHCPMCAGQPHLVSCYTGAQLCVADVCSWICSSRSIQLSARSLSTTDICLYISPFSFYDPPIHPSRTI